MPTPSAEAQGLEIIPVINKVDLPSADVERVSRQIEDTLAIPAEDAILKVVSQELGWMKYSKRLSKDYLHRVGQII